MPLGGHVGPCVDSMCTNFGLRAIKAPRVGGRSSPAPAVSAVLVESIALFTKLHI